MLPLLMDTWPLPPVYECRHMGVMGVYISGSLESEPVPALMVCVASPVCVTVWPHPGCDRVFALHPDFHRDLGLQWLLTDQEEVRLSGRFL